MQSSSDKSHERIASTIFLIIATIIILIMFEYTRGVYLRAAAISNIETYFLNCNLIVHSSSCAICR